MYIQSLIFFFCYMCVSTPNTHNSKLGLSKYCCFHPSKHYHHISLSLPCLQDFTRRALLCWLTLLPSLSSSVITNLRVVANLNCCSIWIQPTALHSNGNISLIRHPNKVSSDALETWRWDDSFGSSPSSRRFVDHSVCPWQGAASPVLGRSGICIVSGLKPKLWAPPWSPPTLGHSSSSINLV